LVENAKNKNIVKTIFVHFMDFETMGGRFVEYLTLPNFSIGKLIVAKSETVKLSL
jgi:hypothetical protein